MPKIFLLKSNNMQQSKVLSNFLDLVKIDSPSGEETRVAEFLISRLTDLGIKSSLDATGNLYAFRQGHGEPVLINAHMDTVEPGRGIKPQVINGEIVSDGSTILGADNKAALASILTALKTADPDKLRSLEILFSVREETGGGISKFDFSRLKSRTGLVPDRASPVGSVVLSSPGILNLHITVTGRSAHASQPEIAVNALNIAASAINKTRWGRIDPQTTTNIGLISGGSAMNTIPGSVKLTGEIRSFSQNKLSEVNDEIKSVFTRICNQQKAVLEFSSPKYCSAYVYAKSDPAVRQAALALKSCGINPVYEIVFGASDANTFAAHGIKVVVIGDGCENPHTVEERVSLASLDKLTQVILAYITSNS
jgi:tripeptide aminopeptidase